MWKNIKKFFKWIADHTGISWIARKISSCWKWLFGGKKSETSVTKQNTSQQEKSSDSEEQTLPKTLDVKLDDEPSVIGGICENKKGVLELFVTINHVSKVFGGGIGVSGNADPNYTKVMDKLKGYTLYVECEKGGIFHITCNKLIDVNKKGAFLSMESVASQDGKTSSDELATMKQMLDLSEKQAIVAVTQISKNPITVPKSEIASSATTPAAINGQLVSA